MAEYTMELRELVERHYPLALDRYPIFDENHRAVLNNKIIQHFWYREIGQETPDRFNRMLGRKMNEIMPYYNQLYVSTLIEYDPLATEFINATTKDVTRTKEKTEAGYAAAMSETTGDVQSTNRDFTQKTGMEFTTDYTSNIEKHKVGAETIDSTDNSDYQKQGDRTVDTTMVRIEDLNEDKTANTTTNRDLTRKTDFEENTQHQQNETHTEDTTENTKMEAHEDFDETRNTTGNKMHTNNITEIEAKDTKFSDMPSAMTATEETVEGDDDGNGGGTTIKVDGYVTTRTVENTTKNTTDIGTENWTENVKTDHTKDNTQTTDFTRDRDNTDDIHWTQDHTSTQDVTEHETTIQDYTHNVKNTNNINQHDLSNEIWHESGVNHEAYHADRSYREDNTSAQADNTHGTQNTAAGENEKNDSERNVAHNQQEASARQQHVVGDKQGDITIKSEGRRGVSPAKLIEEYRSVILNVDMLVIKELEPLFMQMW